MTILLTGGTGKTGVPTARFISNNSIHSVLLASRKGIKPGELSQPDHAKIHAVKFDWFDRSSWANPFDYVASKMLSPVDRIYLVAPMTWDVRVMNEFIDFARGKGVDKFLLLSASQAEAGDPSLGQVHGYLKELGDREETQWMVIRPTWFIENLGEYQIESICKQDTIYSVWEDGKVPFVSAEDIGELAADLLASWEVRQPNWNRDVIIHGPQLFTNDQLAQLLSEVLDRKITHTRITKEEYLNQWNSGGYEELAQGLVDGELKVAQGSEEAIFQRPGVSVGRVRMKDYIVQNKHLWTKGSTEDSSPEELVRKRSPGL
ncbi:Agroclavine dehydrogenase [Leucoagaricus sp. SymC.cos]|nr:Agroclavine dehydrogenase [Leucoagaricus sp. SymC.cos]